MRAGHLLQILIPTGEHLRSGLDEPRTFGDLLGSPERFTREHRNIDLDRSVAKGVDHTSRSRRQLTSRTGGDIEPMNGTRWRVQIGKLQALEPGSESVI